MIEKRAFRRNDARSAPGTLLIGEKNLRVDFDNISLIGARVRARGEKLPPVGSVAVLNMENETLDLSCKVVGLDNGEYYRLKFDDVRGNSLVNLLDLLSRLGDGHIEGEGPSLVLDLG